MQHDTKKVNSFIRYIGRCPAGSPYSDIMNGWMGDTGERVSDAEELQYYISLIPMALKRKRIRSQEVQEQQTVNNQQRKK